MKKFLMAAIAALSMISPVMATTGVPADTPSATPACMSEETFTKEVQATHLFNGKVDEHRSLAITQIGDNTWAVVLFVDGCLDPTFPPVITDDKGVQIIMSMSPSSFLDQHKLGKI